MLTLGTIGAAVFFLALIAGAASPSSVHQGQPAAESGESRLFEQEVLPILKANCAACHSATLAQKELNLSSWESLLKGSASGPIVIPGKPKESLLYSMVDRGSMPPGENVRLADRDIAIIREWIEAGATSGSREAASISASAASYDDIIPVMLMHCTVCHGLRRQEGGLDLRTRESMLRGGQSGAAIQPGHPADSLLLKRIESGEMPPKKEMLTNGVKPVTPPELANLKKWIEQGAPTVRQKPDVAGSEPDPLVTDTDRQFWAFQAPEAVGVPEVRGADRVKNPVDAFLLRKLEQEGLGFSTEAGKLT